MKKILAAAAVSLAALSVQPASAAQIVSLDVQYYNVSLNSNAGQVGDFWATQPGAGYSYTTYSNMLSTNPAGSDLGANGRPVYNASYGGPALTNLLASGELAWWTPGTYGGVTVGLGTQQNLLPTINLLGAGINDNSMFAPNNTVLTHGNQFLTAIYSGSINLDPSATGFSQVTFNLAGDDDVFLFIGGELLFQSGGIHEQGSIDVTTAALADGTHNFQLFYADRNKSDAKLAFSVKAITESPPPPAVPEPATWGMMIAGFGALGVALRRRKATVSFA